MIYTEAIASKDIPVGEETIKQGRSITITMEGIKHDFSLWHHTGIWDLPKEYVVIDENILSKIQEQKKQKQNDILNRNRCWNERSRLSNK